MEEQNQKEIEDMVTELDGNFDLLKDKTFTSKGNIRLVPDILQNGEDFFFPVFSSDEEMGEYGDHFSKVQKHFLETIVLARNNEKTPVGIVVDAFTTPFVLDADLYDVVEKIKSQIVQKEK